MVSLNSDKKVTANVSKEVMELTPSTAGEYSASIHKRRGECMFVE